MKTDDSMNDEIGSTDTDESKDRKTKAIRTRPENIRCRKRISPQPSII